MELVREEVRHESLPRLGLDAGTARVLATALLRGQFVAYCEYCGEALFEHDAMTTRTEWSCAVRRNAPSVCCGRCAREVA